MGIGVTCTIEGTERLKAKLKRLQGAINSSDAKQIGIAGGKPVVDYARSIVHVVTGNLRDTIHVEESDEAGVAQVVAGGDGVDYAADEEFGNSRRPPHPYLRPAVDATKSAVRTAMRQKSYSVIRKGVG
jgi:HK97 gp10 family phage protein